MNRRGIRRAVLGVLAAVVSVVALATTAFAYSRAYHGSDYAGVGSDLRWVEVCDIEQDGNGVYGEFRLTGGGTLTVNDGNGSAGGCGNQTAGSNITQFRVCERNDGCTGWVPAAA